VGELTIVDRYGRPMKVLAWHGGFAGFLAAIAALDARRLAYWHRHMRCFAEREAIARELGRRRISTAGKDQDGQLLLFDPEGGG
jgi:hypothetical protein